MSPGSRALTILGVRLAAVAAVTLILWALVRITSGVNAFPPNTLWATLGLLPVNVLCVLLVERWLRTEGKTIAAALGFDRRRLGRDVLWGLLWLVVLNIPFMLAITGSVFLLYGSEAPEAFETIFYNPDNEVALAPVPLLLVSIVAVVPFMFLNAPTEELVFREIALDGLRTRWGTPAAIAVSSLAFGAQHIAFAPTAPGMLVYFLAFTVWGALAALIVIRQGRLLPVVIAHWIVNITMSAPAIVFPALQVAGIEISHMR